MKKQMLSDLPLILEFEFHGSEVVKGINAKGKAYEFMKATVVTTTFSNEDGKAIPEVTHTQIDTEIEIPKGRHRVSCFVSSYNDGRSGKSVSKLTIKKIISTAK